MSPFENCRPTQAGRQRFPCWLEKQQHSNQQEGEDDESRYVENRRPVLVVFHDPPLQSNFALSDLGQGVVGPTNTAQTCADQ